MSDTPQAFVDRLREEGDRVVDFFNHLSREQWGSPVYQIENHWDLHKLLAHFLSSEIGRKELIVNVCEGGNEAPNNFEFDAYNLREVDRISVESNEDLLRKFKQEHVNLIAIVSAMSLHNFERSGNDPYLGRGPLKEMIKLTYRHRQIHLRDARRCLNK